MTGKPWCAAEVKARELTGLKSIVNDSSWPEPRFHTINLNRVTYDKTFPKKAVGRYASTIRRSQGLRGTTVMHYAYDPALVLKRAAPVMKGKLVLRNTGVVPVVAPGHEQVLMYFPTLASARMVREELDGLIDWMERTA